jgi:fumarate hydratase subunit beta
MEKHITLPLTEELAKTLRAGDTVYLTGTIYTSRDAGHKRMCEALARGEEIPFDPKDAVIYYVGPTPAKPGQVIGSAGPTTSYRMDAYSPQLMAQGMTGIFVVLGLIALMVAWLKKLDNKK